MNIVLWKNEDVATSVGLHYAGDAIVLERNGEDPIKPHYFEKNGEAIEFIIKQTYALLSLGYEVAA
jgi:hypothetical protein